MLLAPVDGRRQRDPEGLGARERDGLETQHRGLEPGSSTLAVSSRNQTRNDEREGRAPFAGVELDDDGLGTTGLGDSQAERVRGRGGNASNWAVVPCLMPSRLMNGLELLR